METIDSMGDVVRQYCEAERALRMRADKLIKERQNMDMGAIFLAIERDAASLRDQAAWAGSMNDGGATNLMDQLRFYKYGRDGILPPEWADYKRQVERETDPEWAELQRLKQKFGEL